MACFLQHVFSEESEIPLPLRLLTLFDWKWCRQLIWISAVYKQVSLLHTVIHLWAGWVLSPCLLAPGSDAISTSPLCPLSVPLFCHCLTQTCPGQARWESPCSSGCTGSAMEVGWPSGNPVLARQCWVAGSACVGRNTWRLMAGWQALWKTWPLHSGVLRRQKATVKKNKQAKKKNLANLQNCCWIQIILHR